MTMRLMLIVAGLLSLTNALAAEQTPASAPTANVVSAIPADAFKETVEVCTNLDMYPTLAARDRDVGMPEKESIALIEASMSKNFAGKLPDGMLPPLIDVVKDIYHRVYADPKLHAGGFDETVFEACSSYRGYKIDKVALKKELDQYVQSAFDPMGRVTLCVKAAQSAANFAQARDNGIAKDRIADVAKKVLANDPATLALAPAMIDEAYDLKTIQVPTFYLYNLRRCESQKVGTPLRPLKELGDAAVKCQQNIDKQVKTDCLTNLFTAPATPAASAPAK